MKHSDVTPETQYPFYITNIRRCKRYVLRIQRRLDKAVADDNTAKIRHLTYLLSKRSEAVKILSVYQVCKVNDGRHTAGIDGMKISKDRETAKSQMVMLLKEVDIRSKPKTIRRVFIPKSNGKLRPLGIPTLKDRINQDIIRTAIEPICEYHFLPCSYGFRPKRSCHDAINDLFKKLSRKGSRRWIVEGDIEGCFDNIDHLHILKTLRKWRVCLGTVKVIEAILKAGAMTVGTPQGGIISPMLANVALTCLDKEMDKQDNRMNPIVRYADDFVVVAKTKKEAESLKGKIKQFIYDNAGLSLSDEKTHITEISEGFNFLGFNIRKYKNDKLIIKPEKDKVREVRHKIKAVTREQFHTAESLIRKLNPILRGWGNYYRHVVSKTIFTLIDSYTFDRVFRWLSHKHPTRSQKWKVKQYFKTIDNDNWVFTESNQSLVKVAKIPIKRFVKVKNNVRLYNMKDAEYWDKREFINSLDSIHNSYELTKLFKEQKGKCYYCNQYINNSDIQSNSFHRHHLIPVSKGGTDKLSNLRLVHDSCHREIHGKLSLNDMVRYGTKQAF